MQNPQSENSQDYAQKPQQNRTFMYSGVKIVLGVNDVSGPGNLQMQPFL